MIAVRTLRGPRGGLSLRLFLIGLALWASMTAWALSSPPGSAPDENNHLAASWAVTHGQPASAATLLVPQQVWRTQCHGPPAVPSGPHRGLSPCFPPTGAVGTDLIQVANMTNLYPPTFHWLTGQFWVGDLTASVYRMRSFVALGSTLLIMVPLVLISVVDGLRGLRRFALPLLVALSPLAFFLFGSVNPSGWEMAGAVCGGGSLAALVQATRRAHAVWALAGMVLGVLVGILTRPGGGLMLLAGLVLAAPIALSRVAPQVPRPRRRFWTVVTICYLALGVGLVVFAVRGGLSIRWDRYSQAERHTPLWHWLTDAPSFGDYLVGSFTRLGWLDTPVPPLVGLIFIGITGYLVLAAVRQGRAAVTASLVMVALAAWFLTTAVLATSTPPDTGLQTRYMWPLYIGVPMIAALALGSGATTSRHDAFAGHVRYVAGGGLIIASSIAFFTNLRRYTVGLGEFPFLAPERWQPPVLSTGTLLVSFIVAYVILVVLLSAGSLTAPIALTRRPSPRHLSTEA